MRIALMIAAGLIANQAQAEAYTASEVVAYCKGNGGPEKQSFCYGYVNGVTWQDMYNKEQRYCPPAHVTSQHMVANIIEFYDGNLEQYAGRPFVVLINDALKARYPCKKP